MPDDQVFSVRPEVAATAHVSAERYREMVRAVPPGTSAMLAHAWVGGSIYGVELGGLLAISVTLVVLRAHWKSETLAADR